MNNLDGIPGKLNHRGPKKLNHEKALQFLDKKWQNQSCPFCNTSNWSVCDDIFELTQLNATLRGPVMPIIAIMCSNCGNTVLANAMLMGLVKPEPEE